MTKLEVLCPLEVSWHWNSVICVIDLFILCVQVIMPNTVCEGTTVTKLFKMVTNHCPQANLATVQRKYFNEGKGHQQTLMSD